jgi:hypothetical protein
MSFIKSNIGEGCLVLNMSFKPVLTTQKIAVKYIDLHIISFQNSNMGDKVTGDNVTGDKVTRGQNDQGTKGPGTK